jgi:hypothetical protein
MTRSHPLRRLQHRFHEVRMGMLDISVNLFSFGAEVREGVGGKKWECCKMSVPTARVWSFVID